MVCRVLPSTSLSTMIELCSCNWAKARRVPSALTAGSLTFMPVRSGVRWVPENRYRLRPLVAYSFPPTVICLLGSTTFPVSCGAAPFEEQAEASHAMAARVNVRSDRFTIEDRRQRVDAGIG